MGDYFGDNDAEVRNDIMRQEPLSEKNLFGKRLRDLLNSVKPLLKKMKSEGEKIGTNQDCKEFRDSL